MAIVVQEERPQRIDFLNIFIWLVILGVVASAIYYIFFVQPQLVEVYTAPVLQNTQQISQVSLQPETVVNDPIFQSLKQYVSLPTGGSFGRNNPFLPF